MLLIVAEVARTAVVVVVGLSAITPLEPRSQSTFSYSTASLRNSVYVQVHLCGGTRNVVVMMLLLLAVLLLYCVR